MSSSRHSGRSDRKKRGRTGAATTIDRRALRTRNALLNALLTLILRKGYDSVSISDIVEAANVGRSTFYTHFTGKEDLLRSGMGGLREMIREARNHESTGAAPSDHRFLGFSRFMFAHTREQLTLYRALMGSRASAAHLDKVRLLLAESIRSDLTAHHGFGLPGSIPRELAVQYYVGAFTSILTWWLDRGAKEPAEKMDAAFRALALHGLSGDASKQG